MLAKNDQKERLLQEINDLEEQDIEKLIRMIHFMKKEILKTDKKSMDSILNYAGMLQDMSDEETAIFSRAIQRRSMFESRDVNI